MAEADIPVDLINPGQVFACLGFLEAAEILLGDAEGGFDWHDEDNVRFRMRASGESNPFEKVLDFLSQVKIKQFGPVGFIVTSDSGEDEEGESVIEDDSLSVDLSANFPAGKGEPMALPIRLRGREEPIIEMGHWADGSSRESFKLYSGNRSAAKIARAMLQGVREKPNKKQKQSGLPGNLKSKGLVHLWSEQRQALMHNPFHVLVPMGGSFNFDPRGAWTSIDAGYSPNDHKHPVEASPVVEILAALGLENARPQEYNNRQVYYSVWGLPLSPFLARVALTAAFPSFPTRYFRFTLLLSGKNKIVTFAQEESQS